jgi:hypothetical protein
MSLEGEYRFVRHNDMAAFEQCGWCWCAHLGETHGQWSVMMRWLCDCKPVVPLRASLTTGDSNDQTRSG